MDVNEAREIANAALAGMAAEASEGLRLDDDGVCRLVFERGGTMYFILDAAAADLIVWSPAGILPSEPPRQTEALRQLMQANLFWGDTNGATLSLASDGETVILARRVSLYGLTGDELGYFAERMLEDATAFNHGLALSAAQPEGLAETSAPQIHHPHSIRG